jgi:tight adherence protein B
MRTRFLIFIFTVMLAFVISHSLIISAAIGIFVSIFIVLSHRKARLKRNHALQSAAPEVIDLLISGIQSGLSLNESLSSLADRGPEILRPSFYGFRKILFKTGDFELGINFLKHEIGHHSLDQIFECLAMAKILGSNELLNILRLLGSFIREDLVLRNEIATKQNWIRNSAHLSAAAPWLLLLLLSTQASTKNAYSSRSGVLVLLAGLVLTAVAYLWMNQLSKLPEPERIFAGHDVGVKHG